MKAYLLTHYRQKSGRSANVKICSLSWLNMTAAVFPQAGRSQDARHWIRFALPGLGENACAQGNHGLIGLSGWQA
jgi:hypothetical protein